MSIQDWHAYAVRVDQQHQSQQEQSGPTNEPIQDLSTFGLASAPGPAPESVTESVAEPVTKPVTGPLAAPEAHAQVTPISPVVTPIALVEPIGQGSQTNQGSQGSQGSHQVTPISLVEPLAPAPPVAPAVSVEAPVVAAWEPPAFVGRPAVVDADLRPVMVDKLAGDLADLTRVLLGVTSAVPSPPVAPVDLGPAPRSEITPIDVTPQGDLTPIDVSPLTLSFAPAPEVAPLVPLAVESIATVTPLTPAPTREEPPTPLAPTPAVPVDVVLSELSFLDG